MAPLNADAQAARTVRSRERLGRARMESERARARRDVPRRSPWSELYWTQTYESLEQTLVPLPSPRSD